MPPQPVAAVAERERALVPPPPPSGPISQFCMAGSLPLVPENITDPWMELQQPWLRCPGVFPASAIDALIAQN